MRLAGRRSSTCCGASAAARRRCLGRPRCKRLGEDPDVPTLKSCCGEQCMHSFFNQHEETAKATYATMQRLKAAIPAAEETTAAASLIKGASRPRMAGGAIAYGEASDALEVRMHGSFELHCCVRSNNGCLVDFLLLQDPAPPSKRHKVKHGMENEFCPVLHAQDCPPGEAQPQAGRAQAAGSQVLLGFYLCSVVVRSSRSAASARSARRIGRWPRGKWPGGGGLGLGDWPP